VVATAWGDSPRHDAQFKTLGALEALKDVKTVQQIAKEFDVHPMQVSEWQKNLSTQAGSVFESGKQQEPEDFNAARIDLYSKVGELNLKPNGLIKEPVLPDFFNG
jgi:transposase-like protein